MPVVVTGAGGVLARAILDALIAEAGIGGARAGETRRLGRIELRATVRTPEEQRWCRERGVPAAVTDLSDARRAEAVLEGAHTVVHLDEGPQALEWLLEAADGTSVRRIVMVATPGAATSAMVGDHGSQLEVVVIPGELHRADPAVVAAVLAADRRPSGGTTQQAR